MNGHEEKSLALPSDVHFRLLLLLCLLGPCVAGFFSETAEKFGLIAKKNLQINTSYVDKPPKIEVLQPQLLSEGAPAIVSTETEHYYQKQILIYCLIGVSILLLIFATLYCYEANKEHSLQIELGNSFSSPSLSTVEEEVAVPMTELEREAEES